MRDAPVEQARFAGPMEVSFKTVLLAPDRAVAEGVQRALSSRYQSVAERLSVEVASGPPREAIEAVRALHGGSPVGFIALDEVAALEALTHGADEAMVWPPGEEQAIHGFFDRTNLRGSVRQGQERLRTSVAHAEKLTALGTLVAGVAHEVNNPLMALQLSVEALRALLQPYLKAGEELERLAERGSGATAAEIARLRDLARTGAPAAEGETLVNEMLIAVQAIADVVRDLRIFARSEGDEEPAQVVNVADLVDQALRLVGREIYSHGYVERDYAPEVPLVLVPPGRLIQVLVNVLVNAAHAIREVERPVHRVRISTRCDDDHVAVSVSDTGPGIPVDAVERIFDPFFTTKREVMGTGLGLSISRTILRNMGGDLIVESVHGDGASFIALVPVPTPDMLRAARRRSASIPIVRPRKERTNVLVVEEDGRLLKAYARALSRTCNILLANDGQEAIDLLVSGSSVDVIVSELSLPIVDGPELYEWLLRERSDLARRTLFTTAEPAAGRYEAFLSGLEQGFLRKPLTASVLTEAIERVVHAPM